MRVVKWMRMLLPCALYLVHLFLLEAIMRFKTLNSSMFCSLEVDWSSLEAGRNLVGPAYRVESVDVL